MTAIRRAPMTALGAALALVLALAVQWIGGGSAAFGASDPAGAPFGNFESAYGVPGGVAVKGWAIDPDTTAPIYVWVTIDGAGRHLYANHNRPDVGAAYPDYGPAHGFSSTLTTPAGTHAVCVTASNVGPGAHKNLGCRTVRVLAGSPIGNFEEVRAAPGGFELKGWAIDPDTTDWIDLWVTIDGYGDHLFAYEGRPDVGAAYPGYGPEHGFLGGTNVMKLPGTRTVCATAKNRAGLGADTSLGCRLFTVSGDHAPFGNFESARAVVGGIEVKGWAADPDTRDQIYVWVTVDGVGRHLNADQYRPDVGAAYPGWGPERGFAGTIGAAPGTHTVCVTASNEGPGEHKSFGCRSVTVTDAGSPFGNLESARGVPGGIEVKGWTIDPDTTAPIYVWVTVDGVGRHLYSDRNRPDVGAAYPSAGADHGFLGQPAALPGTHTVCVTASNVGPGAHKNLGCRSVTVPAVPSLVELSASDEGAVVQVATGGKVVVTLPLDPSSGMVWSIGEGTREQLGEYCGTHPITNEAGTAQVVTFAAGLAGTAPLVLELKTPETDTDPAATFAATVQIVDVPTVAPPAGVPTEIQLTETENGTTVELANHGQLTVVLTGQPGLGFAWSVADYPGDRLAMYCPVTPVPPGSTVPPPPEAVWDYPFRFEAISTGTAELVLEYRDEADPTAAPERTFRATVLIR